MRIGDMEEAVDAGSKSERAVLGRPSVSCVDLFCGAGGLTYGFRGEGVHVTAGIDTDPACRYPYEYNNGAAFLQRNVTELTAADVGLWFRPGSFRVLAGCAPCQPFSTYNQRYDAGKDDKWNLLYEFARLADSLRPDLVTMENVPSIERHHVFGEFVGGLRSSGYHVWFKTIQCADYGVPQTRRRLVLLASLLGDLDLIKPTHRSHMTVRQTIAGKPWIPAGGQCSQDPLHAAAGLSALNLRRIRVSKPGGTWRDWPPELIADCHRTSRGKSYPSVYGRMEWDKPAPTITTQAHGFGNGRFGHPEQDRGISLREAALLQGFPATYRFVRPGDPIEFAPIGRLIGNAVPPSLARAIARTIMIHCLGREPILT
jgi:DNA (cytosine-5)-methyltransferase 1